MRDDVVKFIVSVVVGCILFGLAVSAMYAAHYAPTNSIVEIFWTIVCLFLGLGSLATIMGGIINLLNDM